MAFGLGVDPEIINKLVTTIMGSYRAFRDLDATMVEINPLVITKDKNLVALDAKMSFDDNALFRRPHIAELRDKSQEDPRETYASDRGLAYVGLDGDIGCVVNGAGLAMATLDMIKLAGGEPANFLDIGGGASPERVAEVVQGRAEGQEGEGPAASTCSPASTAATGWRRASSTPSRSSTSRCPWSSASPAPTSRRAAASSNESGLTVITAETLAEAAQKAVAAAKSAAH